MTRPCRDGVYLDRSCPVWYVLPPFLDPLLPGTVLRRPDFPERDLLTRKVLGQRPVVVRHFTYTRVFPFYVTLSLSLRLFKLSQYMPSYRRRGTRGGHGGLTELEW